MSRRHSQDSEGLRCSFCHKAQGVVGKLISSPSDYPRAYICDECIAVCNSIIEDDRLAGTPEETFQVPINLAYFQCALQMTRLEVEQLRDRLNKILENGSAFPTLDTTTSTRIE